MRLTVTVVPGPAQRPVDVVLDLDPATTSRQLRAALAGTLPGYAGDGSTLWVGDDAVVLDDPVGGGPLRDGSVLGLGTPAGPSDQAMYGPELRVVGGPDAGLACRLPGGELLLGRSSPDLPLRDPRASRRHALVRAGGSVVTVEDLGSTNGTTLDGAGVTQPVPLVLGAVLRCGDTLLELVEVGPADTAVDPDGEGGLDYNRPPRLLPPPVEVSVVLPEEPVEQEARGFPVAAMLVPLAFGVVMAAVLGRLVYLLFALLSPVMLVSNHLSDRSRGRTSHARRRAAYVQALAAAHARLDAARLAETAARRAAHPDPAELLQVATGPRRRLWERRRHDEDALSLRVGVADAPARVHLVARGRLDDPPPDPPVLREVPVALPLRAVGVLGIAGPRPAARALARWLAGQVAVLHSPRDAGIVVLSTRDAEADWGWLTWLPHARPADGQDALVLLGNDSGTTARRVAELIALVRARQAALADRAPGRRDDALPAVVVVLDGARALRLLPGVAQVLRDGPAVGVHAVCLDDAERLLPEECTATVVLRAGEPGRASVRRALHPGVEDVVLDQVSAVWAVRVARAMCAVRDVSETDDEAQLPASARLLDLVGLEPPTAAAVAAGWAAGGRTTTAVLGAGTDGPFAIDLRRDGPHGLVAGTTGSGKSELLQTVVASLAVANRPDAMTFVLVDYKGGSAFKDCVRLPHVVGLVTDLDPHLVERALSSLSAELRRREHLLAAAGAKDVEDHQTLCGRPGGPAPLPRLLIVIDEFAAMARDLPDFVSGLVGIAQRGRSLGIHLLLATQRPSGVVSAEIRANSDLRIALRVTDPGESTDVVDAPDAAWIPKSTPGRAYVRLAHGALVPFQAGRVGGRRPGRTGAVRVPHAVVVGWQQLGHPPPRRPPDRAHEEELTDLAVLVEAVRGAAAGMPRQPSPWLPALPPALLLADLPVPTGDGLDPAPYALEDLPDAQAQRTAALHLDRDGHLFAVGAARSGRSQLLRTLAGSLARLHGCGTVHLYGIDCGSGALLALSALPHCGAVVMRGEGERATRLLARLTADLDRRQGLLAASGHASIGELPEDARPPHVVLLLDRWEGFTTTLGELDGGALLDAVLVLLREGAAAGIHLVLTGDRSLLLGRIATTTEDKISFRLSDRGDWTMLGLDPRSLPEQVPPGRAFWAGSGSELQVALLDPDPSGQAQAAALAAIGATCAERDAGVPPERRPFRVDALPARLAFERAWQLRPRDAGPLWAMVGAGGDDLHAVGVDLDASAPSLLVAGPPRSGRSTALRALARGFLAGGTGVVVVAPRPSPLRDLPGVLAVLRGQELTEEDLTVALDLAGDRPAVVVVDDAELHRDCGARELLRRLVKGVPGRAVVLGGAAEELAGGFTGWQVDARKARQGVLLSPQGLTDGDLVGVRLPRSAVAQPVLPGRALVHLGDGRLVTVQVPC